MPPPSLPPTTTATTPLTPLETRQRIASRLRIAWHSAHGGALVLVGWPILVPCLTTAVMLLFGTAALLQCPGWRYTLPTVSSLRPQHSSWWYRRHSSSGGERYYPDGTAADGGESDNNEQLAVVVASSSVMASISRRYKAFRAALRRDSRVGVGTLLYCDLPGTLWLPVALTFSLLWVAAQYSMALSCVYLEPASDAGAPYSAAARIGVACSTPLPALVIHDTYTLAEWAGMPDLRMACAFGVQLLMCMLLGLCCRLHLHAIADLRKAQQQPPPTGPAAPPPAAAAPISRDTSGVGAAVLPLGIAPPASAAPRQHHAVRPRSLWLAATLHSQALVREHKRSEQRTLEHNRRSNIANRRDSDRRRSQKKHSMLAMKYVQLAWGVQSRQEESVDGHHQHKGTRDV